MVGHDDSQHSGSRRIGIHPYLLYLLRKYNDRPFMRAFFEKSTHYEYFYYLSCHFIVNTLFLSFTNSFILNPSCRLLYISFSNFIDFSRRLLVCFSINVYL